MNVIAKKTIGTSKPHQGEKIGGSSIERTPIKVKVMVTIVAAIDGFSKGLIPSPVYISICMCFHPLDAVNTSQTAITMPQAPIV